MDNCLTRRQREVLRLVLKGNTTAQIARTLCISQSTVKFHCHNLLRFYGVSTRYQLFCAVRGGEQPERLHA